MGARIVALLALAALPWLGSAAFAQADQYAVPRTTWGHPDLQGVWDYRTITPLQRPAEFGDREFYTDAEIAALEGNASTRMEEAPDTSVETGLVHAVYLTDPGTTVDSSRRTSLIIDPPNGRMPAMTPTAEAAQAAQRAERNRFNAEGPRDMSQPWLDRPLYERCITRGFPQVIMPTLYNNNIEIVQAPNHIAIVHEMIHETQIIPLDSTAASGVPSVMGDSRGWWEGDTLVVETRNFNGLTSYRGSTESLVVTERFTRTAADTIEFRMTLDDPAAWVSPWTVAFQMHPTDGLLYEYACHEGNRGLENILENIYDAAAADD